MKMCLLLLGLMLGLASQTMAANSLIVTKSGQSFWVTSARKVGDQIKYTMRDTGQEGSVPVADLHGVVPTIRRGKQYKPEDVQKYIDRIKNLRSLHDNLRRQLSSILQEWEAMQRPSKALEEGITKAEAHFAESDKGTKAHTMAVMDLGMLNYKDVGGKYQARIEATIARMKAEYVTINKQRLEEMAVAPDLSVDTFAPFKQLAGEVMREAEAQDKGALGELLETARQATFKAACRKSYEIFEASKSIDAYLEGVRILQVNRNHVADSSQEKGTIDRALAGLLSKIKRARKTHTINEKGYPFSKGDVKLLRKMRGYASRITFVGAEIDEQCFIIPEQAPGRISLRGPFSLPLRLILRCGQRKDQVLAIGVKLLGKGRDHMIKLGPVKFKDGHAVVTLKEAFSDLPSDFSLIANQNGDYAMYVYLAALKNPNAKFEEWTIISTSCGWPISP